MAAAISREENRRRFTESYKSIHEQSRAARAAAMQRRIEEKQRRIAGRREAQQRREAEKQAATTAAVPAPLSVCPWESGAVEQVVYGGVT